MPRIIQIELSDEQLAALDKFVAANIEWKYSEEVKANVPVKKWATVDEYLRSALGRVLEGPLAQFPSPAMQTQLANMKAAQEAIAAAANPKVR